MNDDILEKVNDASTSGDIPAGIIVGDASSDRGNRWSGAIRIGLIVILAGAIGTDALLYWTRPVPPPMADTIALEVTEEYVALAKELVELHDPRVSEVLGRHIRTMQSILTHRQAELQKELK